MDGWQSSDPTPPLYPPIHSYPPPPPAHPHHPYPPISPPLAPFVGDRNLSPVAGYPYPPIAAEAQYAAPYPPLASECEGFAPAPPPHHHHHHQDHDHHHEHHHGHQHHQHSFGGHNEYPRLPAYDHSQNPYGQFPQEEVEALDRHQSHGSSRHEGSHGSHHHGSPYSEEGYGAKRLGPCASGPVVKVFCKANTDFSLAVRHAGVVMVKQNSHDESQHWILDQTWSNKVKDSTGQPAFMLINKASNQALKHAPEAAQQVLLTDYHPGTIDESILWTHSEDMGQGFRTIRMANNILLNLDALKGDKKSGGVREGTPAILFKWKKQENQIWKIIPL